MMATDYLQPLLSERQSIRNQRNSFASGLGEESDGSGLPDLKILL
jgi:hypothetical protein